MHHQVPVILVVPDAVTSRAAQMCGTGWSTVGEVMSGSFWAAQMSKAHVWRRTAIEWRLVGCSGGTARTETRAAGKTAGAERNAKGGRRC
jgi:hypothetical protein